MCAVHDEETMTEVANVRRRRRCNCVSSAFSRRTSGSARSRIWWPLRVTDKRPPRLHARVNAEVGRACLLPDLISWSAFILSVWDLAWMIISSARPLDINAPPALPALGDGWSSILSRRAMPESSSVAPPLVHTRPLPLQFEHDRADELRQLVHRIGKKLCPIRVTHFRESGRPRKDVNCVVPPDRPP